MRSKPLFLICLCLAVTTLFYLVWWSLQEEHSGYYSNLYGYTIEDKLAFASIFTLFLIMLVSFIKVWRDKRFLSFLLGPALIFFLWLQIFDSGTEVLRLNGCFESICSDISIKDNGTFWITVSTQNDSYRYDGNYIIKEGVIHLYNEPKFESFQQLEAIGKIKQKKCVEVNAADFRLWSGCFTLPKTG